MSPEKTPRQSFRGFLVHCLAGRASCGLLAVCCWLCHPIHSDCDPADQRAIAESHAGQTISTGRSATRPLGHLGRCEKCPQGFGSLAIAVSSDFREVLKGNAHGLSTAQAGLCGFLESDRRSTPERKQVYCDFRVDVFGRRVCRRNFSPPRTP